MDGTKAATDRFMKTLIPIQIWFGDANPEGRMAIQGPPHMRPLVFRHLGQYFAPINAAKATSGRRSGTMK